MLYDYKDKDISSCLQSKRVLFVGDSTIRQVFWAMAKKLNRTVAETHMARAEKHTDLRFIQDEVTIDFIWDPFLRSRKLQDELAIYRNSTSGSGLSSKDTSLILIGVGLWFARYIPVDHSKEFQNATDELVRIAGLDLVASPREDRIRSLTEKTNAETMLLLAPVQNPWYGLLSPSRAAKMTADKVDVMNDYLQQLSASSILDIVWSYSLMTGGQRGAYDEGGVHVIENIAARRGDVLLNLRCNGHATKQGGKAYPHNRTCCGRYERPNMIQEMSLIGGLCVLPLLYLVKGSRERRRRLDMVSGILPGNANDDKDRKRIPSFQVLYALTILGLAVCYCFLADRTHLFNKLHKQFSSAEFMLLCLLVLALGLLSVRPSMDRSKTGNPKSINGSLAPDQAFLSRLQTDEWKGWMQFVILVYHYTGASKEIQVYKFVRLLVASYLFMTGFGHTVFFLKRRDYSFRRAAAVLIRLNLLSCILPYMMQTDYLFYYFAPLVSFWFLIIYATLGLGYAGHGNHTGWLVGKILVSAALVTCFIQVHGPLETIFSLLEYTCRIHWDVDEWRFRVSLDLFVVYVGMICAIIFVKMIPSSSSPTSNSDEQKRVVHFVRTHGQSIYVFLVTISMMAIYSYWRIACQWSSKSAYNLRHPYISLLPILSYIILRNGHRSLRRVHSTIFAWLGRCSLETFTLQFHIWLAGDTKGILSIGLLDRPGGSWGSWSSWGRWIEFFLLTIVFFWISHCLADASSIITEWVVNGGTSVQKPSDSSSVSTLSAPVDGGGRFGNHSGNGRLSSPPDATLELVPPLSFSAARHGMNSDGPVTYPATDSSSSSSPSFHRSVWNKITHQVIAIWKKDLRLRIMSLLIVMWILNWIS